MNEDIWRAKYALPGESSVEQTVSRMCEAASLGDPDKKRIFMDLILERRFCPAGRQWRGLGNTKHHLTLNNCFTLDVVEDSMQGIMDSLALGATIQRRGGGIGVNLSTLRPRGAPVLGVGGEASGPVSFATLYNAVTSVISSAGNRRGALMLLLEDWHPDVQEFVQAKSNTTALSSANLSLMLSDAFMEAVEQDALWDLVWDGEVVRRIPAREFLEEVVRRAYDWGEPGVIFIDRARRDNLVESLEGYSLYGTNPCLAKDTWLWDGNYWRQIQEGVGERWRSWKTGRKKIHRLETTSGYYVDLTEDHKVAIVEKGRGNVLKRIRWVEAKETPGKRVLISIPWSARSIPDSIPLVDEYVAYGEEVAYHGASSSILSGFVGASLVAIYSFLWGFFHVEGSLSNGRFRYRTGRHRADLLRELQLLLLRFGIVTRVGTYSTSGWVFCIQDRRSLHRFLHYFRPEDLPRYLIAIGESEDAPLPDPPMFAVSRVKRLTYLGEDEVWDFSMEIPALLRIGGTGNYSSANGIVVHNCGEQVLGSTEVCNLGSVNLSTHVTWGGEILWDKLRETVRYGIEWLDNIIDLERWIDPRYERKQKFLRRVGLGTMGLAHALIKMRLPYSSAAVPKVEEIYRFIAEAAVEASYELGKEKGICPAFEKLPKKKRQSHFSSNLSSDHQRMYREGLRNIALLTQPPTGTTSLLFNASSGIEPVFRFRYTRKDSLGEREVVDPILTEMKEAGVSQEELKPYLLTAKDVKPVDFVHLQRAIQEYTDSSISRTVNLPHDIPFQEVQDLYTLAWKSGLKSLTIYREGTREGVLISEEEQKRRQLMLTTRQEVPFELAARRLKYVIGSTTIYLTVSYEEEGGKRILREVFGNTSDTVQNPWAAALGRVLSVLLQFNLPDRVWEELKETLRKIRGPEGGWFPGGFVGSLPSAFIHAMEYVRGDKFSDNGAEDPPLVGPPCPVCGAPMAKQGGCDVCLSCGYSKCE